MWGGVPPHVTQRNSACCLALLGTGPCWQQGRTLCSTSWRGAHCLYRTAPNTCWTACTAVVNDGRSTAAARGVPTVARAPAPAHLLATGALGMMRQRAPTRAGPSHSRARSAFAMFFPCPPPQVAVCSACAPVVSQPLRLVVARLDADCARRRPLRDAGQPPPPAHCHWPTGAAVPISMRAPPPTLCAHVSQHLTQSRRSSSHSHQSPPPTTPHTTHPTPLSPTSPSNSQTPAMAALLSRTSSSALASPTASCSCKASSTRGLASVGPEAPRRHYLPAAAAPAAKGPTGRRGGLAAARAQAPKRESRTSVVDTLQNMGQVRVRAYSRRACVFAGVGGPLSWQSPLPNLDTLAADCRDHPRCRHPAAAAPALPATLTRARRLAAALSGAGAAPLRFRRFCAI